MKTFVILSDSHGRCEKAFSKLEPLFSENEFLVHLGDGSSDMRPFVQLYPGKTYVCKGNCDFSYGAEEFIIEAEGLRILCCHGHIYGVKRGLCDLAAYAKSKDCEIALYGHTHIAAVEKIDGVLCINPGALGSFSGGSYCYLVVHKGKATPTIVELNLW